MIPELVFDKQRAGRLYQVEKSPDMAGAVNREVENMVGALESFFHFITRRRKERKYDTELGVLFFERFHHGSALFKFAQGSAVNPYTGTVICGKLVLYLLPDVFPSGNKQPGFGIKQRSNAYSQAVEENSGIV